MRKQHAAIGLAAVIALVFLTSCKNGQASRGGEQSMLSPAPNSPIAIAGGAGNVAVGDMDQDGKLDLVVASTQVPSISVLLGQGDGQFRAAALKTITVSETPGEMELGDLNGDGKLDVAITSHDSYGVTVLLGDGKGGLTRATNSPIVMKDGKHPHTHGLGVGDLNGDRKLDLVTVNNADNDVSVAFGDGSGGFTRAPGSPFAVGPSPYPLALGDVNNDGRIDIVATSSATGPQRAQQLSSSFALTLLLNNGRGGFQASQLPLRTGQPWFVAVADVNGDRKPDLVATHHEQSKLSVLLGDGQGRFTEARRSPVDLGHNAWQLVLSDLNRDGRPDMIAADGNGFRFMLGDGSGGFKPAPQSPFATSKGTWRMAVADVNRDGKNDVVTSSGETNTVSVLLGT